MEPTQNPADQVVAGLQKDFKIVGSHRVHSWYAWAIVGIVFGMALGIVYVANRSGDFASSQAATRMTEASVKAPVTGIESAFEGSQALTAAQKDKALAGFKKVVERLTKEARVKIDAPLVIQSTATHFDAEGKPNGFSLGREEIIPQSTTTGMNRLNQRVAQILATGPVEVRVSLPKKSNPAGMLYFGTTGRLMTSPVANAFASAQQVDLGGVLATVQLNVCKYDYDLFITTGERAPEGEGSSGRANSSKTDPITKITWQTWKDASSCTNNAECRDRAVAAAMVDVAVAAGHKDSSYMQVSDTDVNGNPAKNRNDSYCASNGAAAAK